MSSETERGESSLQTVILIPVVFLVAFMCFHVGSLMHQRHVAHVAVLRGAVVASGMTPSSEASSAARREVRRVVSDLGSHLAEEPHITYRDKGVIVTVKLRASTALSFLPSVVKSQTWRPMESFRLEQDRQ